jgi:hypothetical protein
LTACRLGVRFAGLDGGGAAMRRYIVTLAVMALLIGALFRGADETGVRLLKMFGTIGIFLFGVVGTLALNRWQSGTGRRETEAALKSLEPDWLITDWADEGGARPDYVLVGPAGVVAICLDDTPQSAWARTAAARLGRARERAARAAEWVRGHLAGDLPVMPLVVLTRREAAPTDSADGVTVLNPDRLAAHVRSLSDRTLLDLPARVRLTRTLRTA